MRLRMTKIYFVKLLLQINSRFWKVLSKKISLKKFQQANKNFEYHIIFDAFFQRCQKEQLIQLNTARHCSRCRTSLQIRILTEYYCRKPTS